jgi:hypothetical protein
LDVFLPYISRPLLGVVVCTVEKLFIGALGKLVGDRYHDGLLRFQGVVV